MLLKLLTFSLLTLLSVRTLYFYQLKEYRFDRLYDFFRFDKGLRTVFSLPFIISYLVFGLNLVINSSLLFLVGLISLGIHCALSFNKYGFLRPSLTIKALTILILQLFLILYGLFYLNLSATITVLLAPLGLFGLVLIYTPVTKLLKELTIYKAQQKLKKHSNLIIIGITGSYGKSSVKEYLAQVLSFNEKFQVLKTPKNINTDIGVAKVILNSLLPTHRVMIVEMGAYKIGEISNIVKMMPLDFAVITAMAHQHLSLFGSLENIQTAKSEIAQGLKPDGKLYLNVDSKGVYEILNNFNGSQVVTYGTSPKATLQVYNPVEDCTKNQISFSLNQEAFQATTLPMHNAYNLAPVIDIAIKLGLSLADIKMALLNLKPSDNSFKLLKTAKYTIVDDSYNSNLEGFKSAVAFTKSMPAPQKVLITMGMIELGTLSESMHRDIASNCDFYDLVILTKQELKPYFEPYIKPEKLVMVESPDEIIEALQQKLVDGSLILVENRLNPKVFNYLKNS